jgi:hypothetical protein
MKQEPVVNIYVRITSSAGLLARRDFELAICTPQMAPVTSCQLMLMAAGDPQGRLIAAIDRYPRWTEPSFALLARLLHRCDESTLCEPAGGDVRIELCVEAAMALAGRVELVTLTTTDRGTYCRHVDRSGLTAIAACTPVAGSIRKTVLNALHAVLKWPDEPPPVPAPLSRISIEPGESGRPVVRLDSVPQYAREHLVQELNLMPTDREVPVEDWQRFLGLPIVVPLHSVRAVVVGQVPHSSIVRLRATDGRMLLVSRHTLGLDVSALRVGQWLECRVSLRPPMVVLAWPLPSPPSTRQRR